MQLSEAVSLMAGMGYIDAEWKSGALVDSGDSAVDLGGTEVPNTNDLNWVLAANYDAPLAPQSRLRLVGGLQISRTGKFLGLQAWDTVEHPSYLVVNAQIGLQGERWELLLQVENLTDEEYYTDVQRFPNLHDPVFGPPNINIGTMGQPRLVAGSLSYRF